SGGAAAHHDGCGSARHPFPVAGDRHDPRLRPGAAAVRERGLRLLRTVRGICRGPVLGLHDPQPLTHAGRSSATAKTDTPSPRPGNPSPSVVVAETLTGAPRASDSTRSASARRAENRGRFAWTCTATLPIRHPAAPRIARVRA